MVKTVGNLDYQVKLGTQLFIRRIQLKSLTSYQLEITFPFVNDVEIIYHETIRDFHNKPQVEEVRVGKHICIKRGNLVNIAGKNPFRVYSIDVSNFIDSKKNNRDTGVVLVKTREDNVSSLLITPMFFENSITARLTTSYVGCFVGADEKYWPLVTSINFSLDERLVILLYRFTFDKAYQVFENSIMELSEFQFCMDIDDFQVGYIMSIPGTFKKDFELILNGRYSRTSAIYKNHVLKFYNAGTDSVLYHILNRTEQRRRTIETNFGLPPGTIDSETELYQGFTPERELLKQDYVLGDINLKSKINT